ncbi:histone-lysine N-methyltransferase SETMAR [Trichonephila clavipes]|nr:histone-lysine N-methyltransferase SETMAR [Trichonephila clavipes]
MLSKGVLLLHDNARPHTSRTTWELIESFGWEVLDHVPYSPDLALHDFHLFRYLEHSFGGKHLGDNEEVNATINSWLSNQNQTADFFEEGFQNLILSAWLNGYVNKQNCRIWSEANPQVYVETPLHPEKLTVWYALWAGGTLLQKR